MAAEQRHGDSAVGMDADGPLERVVPLPVRLLLQIAGLRLEIHALRQRVAELEAQVARRETGPEE